MASVLGKHVFTNHASAERPNTQFVQLCVEIEAKMGYPETVPVQVGEALVRIPAIYEWKPTPYPTRCSFGHLEKDCPLKPPADQAAPSSDIASTQEVVTSDNANINKDDNINQDKIQPESQACNRQQLTENISSIFQVDLQLSDKVVEENHPKEKVLEHCISSKQFEATINPTRENLCEPVICALSEKTVSPVDCQTGMDNVEGVDLSELEDGEFCFVDTSQTYSQQLLARDPHENMQTEDFQPCRKGVRCIANQEKTLGRLISK